MKYCLKISLFILLIFQASMVLSIEVERFEVLNSGDGLSQNSVQSIFCDSRGYMWFGTMDGLNKYDGYEFKVYKTNYNDPFSLTNNRIISIWEDKRGYIWLESHDGHYHYLDLKTEKFYSFPQFTGPGNLGNIRMTSFLETESDIWLGTNNSGIYKLSAPISTDEIYTVEPFNVFSDISMSNDSVNFILEDSNQNIWVGTNSGLDLIKSGTDEMHKPEIRELLPGMSFTAGVAVDQVLFLGTRENGVLQFDLQSLRVDKLLLDNVSDKIRTLHRSDSGEIIIGTQSSGLFVYNPTGGSQKRFLKGETIEEIFEDSRHNLWISTSQFGITRIDRQLEKATSFELVPKEIQSLVDLQRLFLFEDRDSTIWVATHGGGLGLFDEDQMAFRFFRNDPNDPNSLSSDIAYCVAQDHSGLLWVGTGQFNAGVNKIIPANPLFHQLKVEKNVASLSDNVIRAVSQDSRNNIWLASKAGHLYVYSEALKLLNEFTGIPTGSENLSRFNVYTILEDKRGYLWLGSKGGGLARSRRPLQDYKNYNELTFRIYRNHSDDPKSISSNNIFSLIQDDQGNIWVGTYGSGIDLISDPSADQLVFEHISTANSNLSSDEVRQIFQDSSGSIWVATTFGLNQLVAANQPTPKKFRRFFYDVKDNRSLSYNDVIHIFEDTKRNLWFATFGGGLNQLQNLSDDRAEFSQFEQNDGLISDAVFGTLEDNNGNLWISTENGISKYDLANGDFENYDINNGLQCSNFSEATCFKLKDGRLLFGSLDGVLIVSEQDYKPATFLPPVVFTHFSIFNREVSFKNENSPLSKPIDYTDHLILSYNQSSFSIEYAALSFFDPKKNSYAYTLEGFDLDWYNVKNERKASYTNLQPGEYTFKVKAANWDGTWSDTPRSIQITILPPWWRTRWAYLAYFILAALVFEISRRLFLQYNRLQTDLRVERKVNEIKLKFFTNISHEIRTPLTLILGPLEDLMRLPNLPQSVKTPIEMMSSNGKRMLRLINQLLDFRKIQNQKMTLKLREVEIGSFVNEICHNFDQMAAQRNISFNYPEEILPVKLLVDREKLDSVLFNLLSNAFKFTASEKRISVRIEVQEQTRMVVIKVVDEGKGVAPEKIPLLFQRFTSLTDENIDFNGSGIGLAYSYELVKLHHGEITVESTLGEGSTFSVILPMGKGHYTADELLYVLPEEAPESLSLQDESESEKVPVMQSVETEKGAGEFKILLVEDNIEIRNYIASFLADQYQVFHAGNGDEGIAVAQEEHPDLIVTDLMMPVMDGITMTKQIKSDFALSHIPVVMLTAKSALNDQIEGIDSGAEAYVVKPFHSEYLISIVNNLIRQRQNMLAYFNKSNPFKGDLKITNRDEEFLKELVELIEKNCQDADFNVDALVKETSLGRTVFYNKVKTLTGMSPVEFLRNTKLQVAAQYLLAGGYAVSEAAYLSGFNDLKYFSKKFKERYNCPPSKYKDELFG